MLLFVNISALTARARIVTPTKEASTPLESDNVESQTTKHKRLKRILCTTHTLPLILPWLDCETLTALDKALINSASRRLLENCTARAIKNLQNENSRYSVMQKKDFLFSKNIPLRWRRKSWLNGCSRHQNQRNYISDKSFLPILKQDISFSTPMRDYIHLREGPFAKVPFYLCTGPGLCHENNLQDGDVFDLLFQGHVHGSSIAICHSLTQERFQYISFRFSDIGSNTYIHDNLFQLGSVAVGIIRPIHTQSLRSNLDLTKSCDMRRMQTVVNTLPYYSPSRTMCAHRCPDMVFITHVDTSRAPYKDIYYQSAVYKTYHDTLTTSRQLYKPLAEWCTEYGLLLDKASGTLSLFNHGILQNLVIDGLHGDYDFFIQVEGCPGPRMDIHGKPEFTIQATTFR